jgi:hypothetical protein
MKTAIICKSGIGDFIYSLYYLPCILEKIGKTDITFYVKDLNSMCQNRSNILCQFIEDLFINYKNNVNIIIYSPKTPQEKLIENSIANNSYTFFPFSSYDILNPHWLIASDWPTIFDTLNIKQNKKFSVPTYCHLYSDSREEKRNIIPIERELIFNVLLNKFNDVNLFNWNDTANYNYNTYENISVFEIITSIDWEKKNIYIGVDSWIAAALCPFSNSIVWSLPEWKLTLQNLLLSVKTNASRINIINTNDTEAIIRAIQEQ